MEGIEQAVAGKNFSDFEAEWLLRHGVQRGIEIISGASRYTPPAVLARHTGIETEPEAPDSSSTKTTRCRGPRIQACRIQYSNPEGRVLRRRCSPHANKCR